MTTAVKRLTSALREHFGGTPAFSAALDEVDDIDKAEHGEHQAARDRLHELHAHLHGKPTAEPDDPNAAPARPKRVRNRANKPAAKAPD